MKKIVLISGLDGDYKRNKFGEILDLIPHADNLIKLNALCAICNNGTEAPFTWKYSEYQTDSIIDISVDKYIPLCRKHYISESNKN